MLRHVVGTVGGWIIYALIWIFGRRYAPADIAWLVGPLGGETIGDRPYEETAKAEGLTDGSIRYTGWFRKLSRGNQVIYTGFYMTQKVPKLQGECVKVVFPMPNGNATVVLRPENDGGDGLRLISAGKDFGDTGFYRLQRFGPNHLRVWRIRSLHERFDLYLDHEQTVRCEHSIRFLGFPVLRLHYRIRDKQEVPVGVG